jgi:predicted GNAT family acetyltransferase
MADNAEGTFARTAKEQHPSDADQPATNFPSAEELIITDNSGIGIYEAVMGGVIVAGVGYRKAGNRITLLVTSVFPEFRDKGIPPRLLSGVLEKIRARGETVRITCPFAAEFVNAHPEYADVLDSVHAGRRPRSRDQTLG